MQREKYTEPLRDRVEKLSRMRLNPKQQKQFEELQFQLYLLEDIYDLGKQVIKELNQFRDAANNS